MPNPPKGRASSAPKKRTAARKESFETLDDAARLAIFNGCDRFLGGHGRQTPADLLSLISPDTVADVYGNGGVVADLEATVASMLGKEAALFFVTGTMAQQATLRVHADHRTSRAIVFHPTCHLDRYEERAFERLHELIGVPVGHPREPLSVAELKGIDEQVAALVVELPQRELGGVLPMWDELEAQVRWARDRGAAVHLDGARLFEAAPFYARTANKSMAEIAGLFDTVYVSFYKGLGGIAGCCVAGDADVIRELSHWRIRHGGRAYGLWPYAAAAQGALAARADRFGVYVDHACAIAESLSSLDRIEIFPNPPQTSMFHLRIRAPRDALSNALFEVAKDQRIWLFGRASYGEGDDVSWFELNVGDATCEFSPEEVRSLFASVLERSDVLGPSRTSTKKKVSK